MSKRMPPEQGSPIIQGTRRTTMQKQHGGWDEDAAASLAPPPYRIARASLPVQEQQRPRQHPPHGGASRRYRGSTRTTEQQTAPVVRRRRSLHGFVYVGLTLLCMLVGLVLFSALDTWWQQTQDYLHYGMPRTYQMDAVVGHQDSAAHPSHFIALNLGGHLSVIYGQGADLVAVTLSVAHDQRGQPELVLHYQNNEVILYDGKDGKFHLQPQP